MNLLIGFYKPVRSYLNRVGSAFYYLKKTSLRYKIEQERQYATVNLDIIFMTNDSGRYSYILCLYLDYCNYEVVIKTSWNFFKKIKTYQELLLKEKFHFVRHLSQPINTVVLTGQKHGKKLINITYGLNINKSGPFHCIAPYPMHPLHYKPFSNLRNIYQLAKTKRTVKVFFSGNVNPKQYNKQTLKKEFNVLTRHEVIDFIKTNFQTTNKIQIVKDKHDLDDLMNCETFINSVVISEVGTVITEWFKILSKADFFICPPGVNTPLCHNSIEAMSVGTIPILQYADLFTPALQHKTNCLVYSDYADLKEVIELALEMKETEIELMRNNVSYYYHNYLSIECIAKKVEEFCYSTQSEATIAIKVS